MLPLSSESTVKKGQHIRQEHFYQTARSYVPEDRNVRSRGSENLKSRILMTGRRLFIAECTNRKCMRR